MLRPHIHTYIRYGYKSRICSYSKIERIKGNGERIESILFFFSAHPTGKISFVIILILISLNSLCYYYLAVNLIIYNFSFFFFIFFFFLLLLYTSSLLLFSYSSLSISTCMVVQFIHYSIHSYLLLYRFHNVCRFATFSSSISSICCLLCCVIYQTYISLSVYLHFTCMLS